LESDSPMVVDAYRLVDTEGIDDRKSDAYPSQADFATRPISYLIPKETPYLIPP